MPVFEGLFPPAVDASIQNLLFALADWHSLAKLRMATDGTIAQLRVATTVLGQELRHFGNTTSNAFETMETPSEAAARARRQARQQAASSGTTISASGSRRPKTFSMKRPKMHSLGYYPDDIYMFGTTDVTSTQLVSP